MSEPTQTHRRQNPMQRPATVSVSSLSVWAKIALAFFALLLTMALAAGIAYLVSHSTNQKKTVQEQRIVTTVRSVTGKSAEQDKKDAMAAAENLLVLANDDPLKKGAEARVTALDGDDYTVMAKGIEDKIEWGSDVSNGLKSSTYQTLIALSSVSMQTNPQKKIVPVGENAWNTTYADTKLGSVFVPISVFTGSNNTFSMEMVYVDGQWKLAPYSLVDAVRLSSILKDSQSASATPTHK